MSYTSPTQVPINAMATAPVEKQDIELLPETIKLIDKYFQERTWNDGIKAYAYHSAKKYRTRIVHQHVANIIKCINAIKKLPCNTQNNTSSVSRLSLMETLSQENTEGHSDFIIKNYEEACQFIPSDENDVNLLQGSLNRRAFNFRISSWADELVKDLPDSILSVQNTWINSSNPEKTPHEKTIRIILYQDPDLRNLLTIYTVSALQNNKSPERIHNYVNQFIIALYTMEETSRLKNISEDASLLILRKHDREVLRLVARETVQWIKRQRIKDVNFPSLQLINTENTYVPEFYWRNFDGKIPAELVDLAEEMRLSCQHHTEALFRKFIKLTHRSALDKPYLPALVLAVATLLSARKADNEPLSPLSIKQYVSVLFPSLKKIFEHYKLTEFSEFHPDKHLREYLTSHLNIGKVSDASRYSTRIIYSAVVLYQNLFISSNSNFPAAITSYLLPEFTYTGRELVNFGPIVQRQRQKRKKETAALGRSEFEVYQIFMARQIMLDKLQDAFTVRLNSALENKEELPVKFSLKMTGLTWVFAITSRNLVLERLGKLNPSYRPKILDTNPIYLEYIDSIADDGGRGAPPFFLNYVKCLHDKTIRDQHKEEWDYDFTNLSQWNPGLLRGPFESVAMLRNLAGIEHKLSLEPSVIFDFDALYTGALVGSTALLIGYHLGLRMHEYQQIRLDSPYADKIFVNGEKRPVVRIRLKGNKADEMMVRLVPQLVWSSMMSLTRRVRSYHQDKIPRVKMSDEILYRVKEAPYLFQNNGKGLTSATIHAAMRFMLNGVVIEDDDGNIIPAATHLLRHNFTRTSLNAGGDPRKVGKMLGHSSEEITNYYGQSIIEDQAVLLDLLETKMPVIDIDRLIHDTSLSETVRIGLRRARDTYGALSNVPGGECTALYTCPNAYTCIGCGHKVLNPQQRHEVERELAKAEIDLHDAQEMNSIEAHRHSLRIAAAHRELEVMDALEVLESFRKGSDMSKDLITAIIQQESSP